VGPIGSVGRSWLGLGLGLGVRSWVVGSVGRSWVLG